MNNEDKTGKAQDSDHKANRPSNGADTTTGSSLQNTDFHQKKKLHVLKEDGSFADLPDSNADGSGALDGTVGLGT